MSSNLTGKFVSNTYQRVIQIDSKASSNLPIEENSDNPDGTKFTLLNGLGEIKTSVAIDSAGNTNGGLFLKNTNGYSNVFGIQVSDTLLGEKGLNFFKPISSTEKLNAGIFLKSTGSVWVGYGKNIGEVIIGTPSIPSDVIGYDFYVKDGIQIGRTASSVGSGLVSQGKLNIISNTLGGGSSGFFINNEYPFKIYRYKHQSSFNEDRSRFILDSSGNRISIFDWTAVVVGFYINGESSNDSGRIILCMTNPNNDEWQVVFNNFSGNTSNKELVVDILLIKRGIYSDLRVFDEPFIIGNQAPFPQGGNEDLTPI